MKRKLMIACAALLLGGVVGLMANKTSNMLFNENLEALTLTEYWHGTGTCCVKYKDVSDTIVRCAISFNEINFWSAGAAKYYCCDSCDKASYAF